MFRNLITTIEEKDEEETIYEIEELSMEEENCDGMVKLPLPSSNNPNLSVDLYIKNTNIKIITKTEFDDDNSVLVIILKCETRQCDKNIDKLKQLFSDPYFIVQVCKVPEKKVNVGAKNEEDEENGENYNMKKILNYASYGPYFLQEDKYIAQHWWNELPLIIIKDSSISHLTSDKSVYGIKHKIKTALEKVSRADLYYLCKWNDACDKHKDIEDYPDNTLKWSTKPTATQAIMYTKKSRNYIMDQLDTTKVTLSELLNSHIEKKKLSAMVFTPNIIDYDINMAVSNSDYSKMNECDTAIATKSTETNNNQIILLIILIILIIVVAWFIIYPPVK